LTCGAKEALLAAIRCIVEPGDEILLPAPYWPTFRDQAAWAGARAVATPPDASLGVDMDALEAAVNPLTRAIVVNDPNNPTGRTWGAERLRRVARIAREHDLWLVADQVYTDLVLDGGAATLWTVAPEVHDRTIVVESFSKRYSMCGFRLGAAYGPPAVLDAMARLTSAATTHPCRVAQAAGLAALDTSPAWDDRERERYRALRRQALDALRRIPELECARPEAAFYLFPRLRGRDGAAVDDARVCADLAARWGLLLQPGSAFGAPGHLRLSYAVDPTTLARGLDRLGEALAELDPVYALPSLEHSL
jgi:aspartate aminotransferase